jgi:hypothetical protein
MSGTDAKTEMQAAGVTANPSELEIHFLKGNGFRVVHITGAWFGADPEGNLHLTFFNDRAPIPKKIVLNVNEDGVSTGEIPSKRESKQGIVRELEFDVVLSLQAASRLHESLGENLEAMKRIRQIETASRP